MKQSACDWLPLLSWKSSRRTAICSCSLRDAQILLGCACSMLSCARGRPKLSADVQMSFHFPRTRSVCILRPLRSSPVATMNACSRCSHAVQTARGTATTALRPVAASRPFTSGGGRAWASVACRAQDDNRQASPSTGVVVQEPAASPSTLGSTAEGAKPESTWTKIKKFGVAG